MSERLVKWVLCDVDGCDKERANTCKNCGKDYCWEHKATVECQGQKLEICQTCLTATAPELTAVIHQFGIPTLQQWIWSAANTVLTS